jgi:seryl-tRNA(Sec) selenium transferase
MNALSRRDLFRTGGAMAAGLASAASADSAPSVASSPEVYTRIGVRPFINCTATLTINGGSQMLDEVIATVEQASHYHVNLDELMEKVGDCLAGLLQVEWGIVTSGAAAALVHATAGCIAGADPEKMQRLPNLAGLKDEVIMPRESRVVYDHAVRTLGVKIVEVNSPAELRAAIGSHTAMIEVLGNYFGSARLDLKDVAPIARQAGIPVLVDAAADYLVVPNPYLALGADLVAYSGGKVIRGPQNAGLLIGRRDLVRAAWANSAPHHAFGRGLKVGKEQVVGMLRAVEVWRSGRDLEADFRQWKSWYAEISGEIARVAGVVTEVHGPVRGGPFPTLNVSWDPSDACCSMASRALCRMPKAKGTLSSSARSRCIRASTSRWRAAFTRSSAPPRAAPGRSRGRGRRCRISPASGKWRSLMKSASRSTSFFSTPVATASPVHTKAGRSRATSPATSMATGSSCAAVCPPVAHIFPTHSAAPSRERKLRAAWTWANTAARSGAPIGTPDYLKLL